MYSGPPMSAAPMYSGPPMSAAPMYSGPPPGSYTEVQRTVVPTTRMARRRMVVTPPPRTMAVAVPGYQIVDQPPMMTPLPMPVEMPPMEVRVCVHLCACACACVQPRLMLAADGPVQPALQRRTIPIPDRKVDADA